MSVGAWEQEHKPCSPTPKNLQDRHAIIYPKEGENSTMEFLTEHKGSRTER
jgi:hypothetical protein